MMASKDNLAPVPLYQREFRQMTGAELAVAKRLADLVDIGEPGREQPLHVVFGRGVQVIRNARAYRELAPDVVEPRVAHRMTDEDRCLAFEDIARGEELARHRQRTRASAQGAHVGNRFPSCGRRSHPCAIAPLIRPRAMPVRMATPAARLSRQETAPAGSSNMTVEPMLNCPSDAPRARVTRPAA